MCSADARRGGQVYVVRYIVDLLVEGEEVGAQQPVDRGATGLLDPGLHVVLPTDLESLAAHRCPPDGQGGRRQRAQVLTGGEREKEMNAKHMDAGNTRGALAEHALIPISVS